MKLPQFYRYQIEVNRVNLVVGGHRIFAEHRKYAHSTMMQLRLSLNPYYLELNYRS